VERLLIELTAPWMSWYADSTVTRTLVTFAHVGGLVVSAGRAVVTDRAVLRAASDGASRPSALGVLVSSHPVVLSGLVVVILSGVMLFASDVETYFISRVYWMKMSAVALLITNGAVMRKATRNAERGRTGAWSTLRATAIVSLTLWTVTTLLGAALPNV